MRGRGKKQKQMAVQYSNKRDMCSPYCDGIIELLVLKKAYNVNDLSCHTSALVYRCLDLHRLITAIGAVTCLFLQQQHDNSVEEN